MLAKEHRLRATREFVACLRRGRAAGDSIVTVHLLTKSRGPSRLGVAVGRRIGGPVTRNRVKRLMREAVRPIMAEPTDPFDLVLVARSGAQGVSFDRIAKSVRRLVRVAQLKSAQPRSKERT
jgi:ribonuclease P protein component